MGAFVGTSNVELFADQLSGGADAGNSAALMRLLVEEEDKLGAGLEALGVAEMRVARGRHLIEKQQALIASLQGDGKDPREARALLDSLGKVQAAFEDFREKIIRRLDQSIL